MRREILFVILVGIVVGMGSSARGESPAVLLEKGIFAEETKGDLDGAISIYKQIIEDAQANRRYVAEAQYRLGVCHLKKGDKKRAAACFRTVLSKFPLQDKIVTRARERLGKIAPTTQPRLPKKEADNSDRRPTVVSTTPVALADDVDPSLKQITVMFDRQMMVGSWSWMRGGKTFPKTTGGPSYDSQSRTICTLPVRLAPGTVYWVGINGPKDGFFQTMMDRIPARPYVILFATRTRDGKPTPLPPDMLAQAKEINARGREPTPATGRPASTRRVGISATPPAVQRRYVGKTVADFPERLDLSIPESAWAAYHRAGGRMNAKALVDVSWVKFDPKKLEKSWKRAGKEDMASYNKAQLEAAIVEVLTYRKSLARVTSYLKFPQGVGRRPYSLRTFGRIDGQWKNLGEDRVGSVDEGRKSFEKKKEILWRYFQRTKASVGAGPANKR